jgi:phage FluMu gp28-like protein
VVEAESVEFDPEEPLLWYQRDFIGWQQAKEVVLVQKSRRVGISFADAFDSVMTAATSKKAGGMDCFYIGYNKDMAREYIDTAADWAKKFEKVAGEISEEVMRDADKDITVFRVKFASGFQIVALSSRPSNLRGMQGKVTIDEAAFHDDLPGLVKAAMALLMWGGRVVVISTHEGEDNPFNEMIKDADKNGFKVITINFKDALEQGLYQRICQVRGKDWTPEGEKAWKDKIYKFYGDGASEELDVIPSGGAGIWLSRALIEKRQVRGVPVIRYEQPDDFALKDEHFRTSEVEAFCEDHLLPLLEKMNPLYSSFFGEDFARSGDVAAIWPLQETPDLRYTTPFVMEMRNIPFKQQEQILFYIVDRLPRFAFGKLDARGNGQYLAEVAQQRYGEERIEQVMLSEKWYRENMPRMKDFFEGGDVDIPKDSDIVTDLRMVTTDKGVAKVPQDKHSKGTDGKNRHGDTAIALALAISSTKEDRVEYDYYSGVDDDDDDAAVNWKKAEGF